MHILSAIKKIFQPDIQTLNKIEISKANILYNLAQLRTMQPKSAFFPVLKANAYGHGIVQMLEILKGQNFPYVAVDSYPEYQLVHKHSDFAVLLIGETLPENYRFFDVRRTAFVVYNVSTLQALVQLKTKVRIHLFLNTGMNREGVQMENLPEMLTLIQANPRLELEGVMSHFHSADADLNSLQEQIGVFKKMTKLIEDAGFAPKRKHIGASAGLLQMQDEYFTAYRP